MSLGETKGAYLAVEGAITEMRQRAQTARLEAGALDDPDSYGAAALRGKARGYSESADLLRAALSGGTVRSKFRPSQKGDYPAGGSDE